jgi:alkylation response protein AidB-like acyl-CoA dehydrogenase
MSGAILNQIIRECARFSKNEIAPFALEADLNHDTMFARTVWDKSVELDIPTLLIPEADDGVGYSNYSGALVLDTLASECAGIASVFAHHFCVCALLSFLDNDARKQLLNVIVPRKSDVSPLASIVFLPELDESELVLEETRNGLRLNGFSPFSGNTALADLFIVFTTESSSDKDVTCLLIEREAEGVVFAGDVALPGLKANSFQQIEFRNVQIPEQHLLGSRGKTLKIMNEARDVFRGFIAAMATGAARRAYQQAFSYAQERFQFGKMIIQHQEIQRILGSMLLKITTSTAAYSQLFNPPKLKLPLVAPVPSLTKVYCTDAALEVAIDAVQVYGGYGYMHEYGLEKIMRDMKTLQLLDGRNPHHLIETIARQV